MKSFDLVPHFVGASEELTPEQFRAQFPVGPVTFNVCLVRRESHSHEEWPAEEFEQLAAAHIEEGWTIYTEECGC